jgi:DNA-binding transcriptional MerR regulator
MKIGEIAQQTRVSKSIIRYYEDKGVLPRAVRDGAGYRDYGDAELARIQLVTVARRLGCSFQEIQELVAVKDGQTPPSERLLELLRSKIVEVEREIDLLRQVQCEMLELQETAESLRINLTETSDLEAK